MSEDQTLAGDTSPATGNTPFGTPNGRPAVTMPQLRPVETVLDLDEVMSQARRVERVARICLRGDLQAEYDDLLTELAGLVDEHGHPVTDGDQALADVSRAQAIADRLAEVKRDMADAVRTIRFQGLVEDDWRAFVKVHADAQGNWKDPDTADTELVAKCAIAPILTVDQVRSLRGTLTAPQFAELASAALRACTTGGVDVPKSPTFSASPRPASSGRS